MKIIYTDDFPALSIDDIGSMAILDGDWIQRCDPSDPCSPLAVYKPGETPRPLLQGEVLCEIR